MYNTENTSVFFVGNLIHAEKEYETKSECNDHRSPSDLLEDESKGQDQCIYTCIILMKNMHIHAYPNLCV
jgi:hypothetical protein